MKNIACTIFGVKKRDQCIKLLESQKPYDGGGMFRLFPENENISEFLDTLSPLPHVWMLHFFIPDNVGKPQLL